MFIDKPTGSKLSEVVAIFQASEHYGVPMFSSSSLRYSEGAQAIRAGKVGQVLGCSHLQSLFARTDARRICTGTGFTELKRCTRAWGSAAKVSHTSTADFELAVGRWSDGRIGTFRGLRAGSRATVARRLENRASNQSAVTADIALLSSRSLDSSARASSRSIPRKRWNCMRSCRQRVKANNGAETGHDCRSHAGGTSRGSTATERPASLALCH